MLKNIFFEKVTYLSHETSAFGCKGDFKRISNHFK